MTKEHILPAYLRNRFLARADGAVRHEVWDDTSKTPIRTHDLDSHTIRQICSTCNNGWMAKLEERFKPLMLRMLDGPPDLGSLSRDERCMFSRWAIKTAVMLLGGQRIYRVPWELLRDHESLPPKNCIVAAGFITGAGMLFSYVVQGEKLAAEMPRLENVSVGLRLGTGLPLGFKRAPRSTLIATTTYIHSGYLQKAASP